MNLPKLHLVTDSSDLGFSRKLDPVNADKDHIWTTNAHCAVIHKTQSIFPELCDLKDQISIPSRVWKAISTKGMEFHSVDEKNKKLVFKNKHDDMFEFNLDGDGISWHRMIQVIPKESVQMAYPALPLNTDYLSNIIDAMGLKTKTVAIIYCGEMKAMRIVPRDEDEQKNVFAILMPVAFEPKSAERIFWKL